MIEIINVIIRGESFVTRYETQRIQLEQGDFCLVDSKIGIQLAKVVGEARIVKERFLEKNDSLRKITRKASENDLAKLDSLIELEKEAFKFCLECVEKRELSMKLIRVIFAFDRSKALFMFTADSRVDFRELVRDLAHEFKTRIEMKQIGVRDEARILGGIGNCGQPLCCIRFIREFSPVSIKMAKDQGLSLIPSKISGLCGRLMCCLQFEHGHYAELMKNIPRVGNTVKTPKGLGKVKQVNILKSSVKVELEDGDTKEFKTIDLKTIPKKKKSVDKQTDNNQSKNNHSN